MTTETIELEIVSPVDDAKLVKYAAETGLEKTSTETLVEAFRPIFLKSREAIAAAQGVAESVKDATCVREIMHARACRLAIRAVRLESDEARKKHKQHALLYGRAVDGFHNILLADLSPVETALKEAEDFAERAEAARLAAENARLQAEVEAREAAYKAEREATRLAVEKKLAEERAAAARVAAEIKAKADAEAARVAEAARIEKEKALAAAKAESDRLAEIARKERQAEQEAYDTERKRVFAEQRAERARVEKIKAELAAKAKAEADAVARIEKERKAAADAAKKAAAAADGVKLKRFAEDLRSLRVPLLKNAKAQSAIADRVEALAAWIESQATADLI